MMFGQDRNQLRAFYRESWRKFRAGEPLQALEQAVAAVIGEHPEYHALLEKRDPELSRDYDGADGQSNPFLHMGLHLALREQIATDRPPGIRAVYQQLLTKLSQAHETEHCMMECLAETLWQAQRNGIPPDENAYLQSLQNLLNR